MISLAEAERLSRALYELPRMVEGYTVPADEPLGEVETEIAEHYFRPGDRLLDLGCGGGREAFGLARRGLRVVGVDLSAPLVERARASAGDLDVSFLVGSAARVDFPPASFDAIWLASEIYPEIPGREARIALLRRLAAFARPGGVLVVFAHCVPRRFWQPSDRILRDPIARRPFFRHRFSHESEARAEFAGAGLRVSAHIASAFVLRRS